MAKQDNQITVMVKMNGETKEVFEKLRALYKKEMDIELSKTQLVEICIKQWYKTYSKERKSYYAKINF